MQLILIIILAAFISVLLIVHFVWRRRLQFSLRTLLLFVTFVAIVFSAIQSWIYLNTARTTWLDPVSSEAEQLTPKSEIIEKEGVYTAKYNARNRDLHDLLKIMMNANLPSGSKSKMIVSGDKQQVEFEFGERKPLEDRLSLLMANDTIMPGSFVIRGRIVDSSGQPVSSAVVDLMGSYVYINHFITRDDGGFLMFMTPPANSGYYLRIRYDNEKHQINTRRFTLDATKPEMAVLIQVK